MKISLICAWVIGVMALMSAPSCLDSRQNLLLDDDPAVTYYHGYISVERDGQMARSYSVLIKKEPGKTTFSVVDLNLGGPYLGISAEYGGNADTVLLDLQVKRASEQGVISSSEPNNEEAKTILAKAKMEILRRDKIYMPSER